MLQTSDLSKIRQGLCAIQLQPGHFKFMPLLQLKELRYLRTKRFVYKYEWKPLASPANLERRQQGARSSQIERHWFESEVHVVYALTAVG